MRKTFKLFVDFDKEERWLNQMAAEGHLVAKGGPRYLFTPIPPGSAIVRIDYRPSMNAPDFEDYKTLFSDTGWQHLSGSRTSGTQYFASAGGENTEIFSETASKAQRYQRAIGASTAVTITLAVIVFALWSSGNAVFNTLLSPTQWYLTPGIWEKQGWDLIGAILFETPFVALRIGGPVLLAVVSLGMLIVAAYQGFLYRRAIMTSRIA